MQSKNETILVLFRKYFRTLHIFFSFACSSAQIQNFSSWESAFSVAPKYHVRYVFIKVIPAKAELDIFRQAELVHVEINSGTYNREHMKFTCCLLPNRKQPAAVLLLVNIHLHCVLSWNGLQLGFSNSWECVELQGFRHLLSFEFQSC